MGQLACIESCNVPLKMVRLHHLCPMQFAANSPKIIRAFLNRDESNSDNIITLHWRNIMKQINLEVWKKKKYLTAAHLFISLFIKQPIIHMALRMHNKDALVGKRTVA